MKVRTWLPQNGRSTRSAVGCAIAVAIACAIGACAAVYPEMQTAVRPSPENAQLEPPPAEDLYYIYFAGAWVPPKDRGGLAWSGGAPDPFATLIVDGVERIVTPVESSTREPTWPKQERKNLVIRSGAEIYVEVWDKNPVTNHPICRVRVRDLASMRSGGENEIWCDSGARVRLHVEPAKALIGIGLYYENRGKSGVRVTRVITNSPAARAGLSPGDKILAIQGKSVSQMDALEVKSSINLHARSGLKLDVWFKNGKRHLIELKEGPLYPTEDDNIELSP